jgi:hypothetical protein
MVEVVEVVKIEGEEGRKLCGEEGGCSKVGSRGGKRRGPAASHAPRSFRCSLTSNDSRCQYRCLQTKRLAENQPGREGEGGEEAGPQIVTIVTWSAWPSTPFAAKLMAPKRSKARQKPGVTLVQEKNRGQAIYNDCG